MVGERSEINPGRDEPSDGLDLKKKLKRFLLMAPGNL
jgi:hypothetical protein